MKWILTSVVLFVMAVAPLAQQNVDTTICCFADSKSELSILHEGSLNQEKKKIHRQKLHEAWKRERELAQEKAPERRKKNGEPAFRYECSLKKGIYEECTQVKVNETSDSTTQNK